MATLYESYTTGDNYGALWITNGEEETDYKGLAQTFTPDIAHIVSLISVKLLKGGGAEADPGTVIVAIYAVDGDGEPTGDALGSGTIDGYTLTNDAAGDWYDIDIVSETTLEAGTQYIIYITAPDANDGNYMTWRVDSVGATYSGGHASVQKGGDSSWIQYNDADFMFEEYGGLDPGSSPPPSSNVSYSKKLVAISNNQLWYESSAGTMEVLTAANDDIDVTLGLDIFESDGKVFIVNDTNLKVADFINIKITTTDIGSHPPDHGTVLTSAGGAQMIVDYITALTGACTIYGKLITATEFGTEAVTGTDDDGNAISFTGTAQVSGPHWYDWTVYGNDSTYGVMPSQAVLGCNYRGRAQLSGDRNYPHQWNQSRQKNPWDWNYIANDTQAPVAGGNSDASEIGDIIIATIPYKDDYMIYGCANTLWYLIGDAAESGTIQELSLTAGIIGAKTWCWDNKDNLFILTTSGLQKIPPGFGPPENVTLESYPDFIKDIAFDSSTDRLTMAYDRENNGINIFKTTLTTGANENWWYDLRTGGLFPDFYPEECGVYSAFYYESVDPAYKGLLFGCFDGYIRSFDSSAVDDDIGATDEAIDSYVDFGPLETGKENKDGKLISLTGILAGGGISGGSQSDSDDVYYKIYGEISAEKILERMYAGTNVRASGTISAPGRIRGSAKKRKVKAAYIGIRIGNDTAEETWAMEKLLVNSKECGRIK